MPSRHEWLVLVGFIGLCFAVAALGSLFTTPVLNNWYVTLHKPTWTPPNWIFAPVWSALYLAMAIAAWLVWRTRNGGNVTLPLFLFVIQLTLNLIWSGIFFGLQQPGAALIEIIILWGAIAATLVTFWNATKVAGWLFVPYLAWVTFALALNFSIWRLNS